MNQNLKNLLGVISALAILTLSYAALSYVNSYGKAIQPSSFRSFSVSGEGRANAVPDIAEFNFQVITEGGTDIANLQAKNTETMNKAIDFVKTQGISDQDIKTQSYNVSPRYQTADCRVLPTPLLMSVPDAGVSAPVSLNKNCPPPSIVGYTISQTVGVKIRDFQKIGGLMSGIVKNGANEVGALSFAVDDPTKAQDKARDEAIAKAQAKAEAIAKAGGFKIGRLLGIQEGSQYPMYNTAVMTGFSAKSESAAPNIQPGSQEINVSVSLQYEIE